MDPLQFFDNFVLSCSNQEDFFTEQQNTILCEYISKLLTQNNIFVELPLLLVQLQPIFQTTVSQQISKFSTKDYCRRGFIFMLFIMGILKQFPNCLQSQEFKEQITPFENTSKFYEVSTIEQKSLVSTTQLIINTIVQVFSTIKIYGESSTSETISHTNIYGKQYESFVTNQNLETQILQAFQTCPFSQNTILQSHFRLLLNITTDLVSQLQDFDLINDIKKYLFNNLKELQLLLEQEIKYLPERQQLQSLPFIDSRIKFQYQIIVCGEIIQAISSSYSHNYAYLISSNQDTSLQTDMITYIAELIINVVNHFQNGLEVDDDYQAQMDDIFLIDDFQSIPNILTSQYEIIKAEALYYFVICCCIPLLQVCHHICGQDEYVNLYSGCIKFNKSLQYSYQQGNVIVQENLTNLSQGNKLYYQNLFKFCTCQYGQEKNIINSQPELVLLGLSCNISIQIEELALYISNEDSVFDISEALFYLYHRNQIQLNDLLNFVSIVDQKRSNIPNQLQCLAQVVLQRFFDLIFNYVVLERSLYWNIQSTTNISDFLKKYFYISRNTYFSNIIYCCRENNDNPLQFRPLSMAHLVKFQNINISENIIKNQIKSIYQNKQSAYQFFYQFLDDQISGQDKINQICILALRSSDNALNIIEGLLLNILNSDALNYKSCPHMTTCTIINALVHVQYTNKKLFRQFILQSKHAQLVLLDCIGSWALGLQHGQSIIMQELYQIQQDVEPLQPDDFLQEPFSASQFQRLFSGDYSLNQNNPLQEILYHNTNIIQPYFANSNVECLSSRPFNFLATQDKLQIDLIYYLAQVFNISDPNIEFLSQILIVEQNQTNIIASLFNSTFLTVYLLGISQRFPDSTLLLKQLNFIIQDNSCQNNLQKNFQLLQNFTNLKLCIFRLVIDFQSDELIEELILLFQYNKGDIKQLYENIFPNDFLFQQKQVNYTINKQILLQNFITSIANDFNSQKYAVAKKLIYAEKYQVIGEFYKQIKSPDLFLQISNYSLDVLLSMHILVAGLQFDDIEEPNDDVLIYLDNYNKVSEYEMENKKYPIDYTSFENLILQQCVTFYAQCKLQRFKTIYDKDNHQEQYVIQIIKTFVKIFQEICRYQSSLTIVKEINQQYCSLVQFYHILLAGFCDFLQINKEVLKNEKLWLYDSQLCSVKEFYTVILQSIFKIHTKISDQNVQEISIQALKQLFQLLNPNSLYDQNFLNPILRINEQSPYTQEELDQILKSSSIGKCQANELIQFLRNQQTGLMLSQSLLRACLYNNEHHITCSSYFCYNSPQQQHFQARNQSNLIVPVSLLLVFKFHPQLTNQASKLLNPILNTSQTFNINPLINEILSDIIEMHQSLIQFKDSFGFQQQNQFAAELFHCLLQALQWLMQHAQLTNDDETYQFIDILCQYIQVENIIQYVVDFKKYRANVHKYIPDIQLMNKNYIPTSSFNKQIYEYQSGQDSVTFDIHQTLTENFILLNHNSTNFNLLFSYCINTLIYQANKNISEFSVVLKLNIIILSLFAVNPIQIIVNINQLSKTNSVQTFILLYILSKKNEQHVPVFFQYLIKNYLDFEQFFNIFINEEKQIIELDDINSDTSSDMEQEIRELFGVVGKSQNTSRLLIEYIFKYRISVENFLSLALSTIIAQQIVTKESVQYYVQNQLNLEQPQLLCQVKLFSASYDTVITNLINLALVTIYKSILDFAGIVMPTSQILEISMGRQQKLIASQQNHSGFSNSALLAFQMIKRVIMQSSTFQLFDTRCFCEKDYIQTEQSFFKQSQPVSQKVLQFQEKYLKILMALQPKLWPDYVQSQFNQLLEFMNNLVCPEQNLSYEQFNFNTAKTFNPVIQHTPHYQYLQKNNEFNLRTSQQTTSIVIDPSVVAFLFELAAQSYQQLIQPEELINNTTSFSQLVEDAFVPDNEFFINLNKISLSIALCGKLANPSIQQFQVLKFIDIVQAILSTNITTDNMTNYCIPILVRISLSFPSAEIGFRTGFLCDAMLKENITMCPQGMLLACIFKEGVGRAQEAKKLILSESRFYVVQSQKTNDENKAIECVYEHYGFGELRFRMKEQRNKFEQILQNNTAQ